MRMIRSYQHNVNTVQASPKINRMYDVPTSLMLPTSKGIYNPRTATITQLEAPTPQKGNGDPRVKGKRTRYVGNVSTHVM